MKYARFALVAMVAVSLSASASSKPNLDEKQWETAKHNYIALLSHENAGVKSSAASIIRKYNIVEAVPELTNVLNCENCETVKFSAALALVSIAGEKGEQIIRHAMETEENELVVAFYKSILHEGKENSSSSISEN